MDFPAGKYCNKYNSRLRSMSWITPLPAFNNDCYHDMLLNTYLHIAIPKGLMTYRGTSKGLLKFLLWWAKTLKSRQSWVFYFFIIDIVHEHFETPPSISSHNINEKKDSLIPQSIDNWSHTLCQDVFLCGKDTRPLPPQSGFSYWDNNTARTHWNI